MKEFTLVIGIYYTVCKNIPAPPECE